MMCRWIVIVVKVIEVVVVHVYSKSYTSRFWVCGGASITGGEGKSGKGKFLFFFLGPTSVRYALVSV